MGLAGAKNKKKWAKDPNNNAWSRNTDTFAQKIMRSQGWAPGDYLGAKDAAHSQYYGAANANHIHAVLKDDNMGLGAKRNGGDECVGLFDFQALLGRLNGQSEALWDEERQKREALKINTYLQRKLGTVRFVFGGYLVGDQEEVEDAAVSEGKKLKKSKKSKAEEAGDESKAKRRAKKERRRREKEPLKEDASESNAEADDTKTDDTDEAAALRKNSKDKKEKKEKKEKRKKSKDEDASDPAPKTKKRKSEKEDQHDSSNSSALPTPAASGTATPVVPHRHLARQRFIAQKRAAVMDQAALNQIFMIKT